MKISIQFESGQSRYGSEAVNYMMPALALDEETREALNALQNVANKVGLDLYEECSIEDADEADAETFGYDDMADTMADKLRWLGVDLTTIEWWYGSEPDGSPKHVE